MSYLHCNSIVIERWNEVWKPKTAIAYTGCSLSFWSRKSKKRRKKIENPLSSLTSVIQEIMGHANTSIAMDICAKATEETA